MGQNGTGWDGPREPTHRAILEQMDLRTLAVVLVLARERAVGEAVEHL
jgi:hypothetical protein